MSPTFFLKPNQLHQFPLQDQSAGSTLWDRIEKKIGLLGLWASLESAFARRPTIQLAKGLLSSRPKADSIVSQRPTLKSAKGQLYSRPKAVGGRPNKPIFAILSHHAAFTFPQESLRFIRWSIRRSIPNHRPSDACNPRRSAKITVAKALHGQRFPMPSQFLRCELFSQLCSKGAAAPQETMTYGITTQGDFLHFWAANKNFDHAQKIHEYNLLVQDTPFGACLQLNSAKGLKGTSMGPQGNPRETQRDPFGPQMGQIR